MNERHERLLADLRSQVHSGRFTIGSGWVSSDGSGGYSGGHPIMVPKNPSGAEAAVLIEMLLSENKSLRKQIVYGFYEEEVPIFTYEEGAHPELSYPITAEEITDYVNSLRKNLELLKDIKLFLTRFLEWDQFNPPMTGDHTFWKCEIERVLKEISK